MVSCLYYVGIGDWQSAERSAQRCQALCEPMDDRVNWTNAQAVRFWMSHYRSHEAAALRCRAQPARSRRRNRQSPASGVGVPLPGGLRAAARTSRPRPWRTCRRRLECLGETAALNERIPTLGILALAQLRSGELWSARATRQGGAGADRARAAADRPRHARGIFVAGHGGARCLAGGAVARLAARDREVPARPGPLSQGASRSASRGISCIDGDYQRLSAARCERRPAELSARRALRQSGSACRGRPRSCREALEGLAATSRRGARPMTGHP